MANAGNANDCFLLFVKTLNFSVLYGFMALIF